MEQLAQDFIDSGTVNEDEGWATGFDPAILQAAQEQAQQKLEAHIETLTDPTVGDVIGGRKTIIKEYPALPSSIPNRIVAIGTRYDKLPTTLQQHIEFAFGKDILGDPIDSTSFVWSTLNNEKVTLSFKPATEADEAALQSLIPEGITDVSQLPTSIPSYLVNVIPEIKVNGEIVKTGTSMRLGEELKLVTGIRFAGRGYLQAPRSYDVVAGSYLNLNVFAGSVSPTKLEQLQTRLNETKDILENGTQAQQAALTRDDILGDMFYAGSAGYYLQLMELAHLGNFSIDGYYLLTAGYGTFGYEPEVNSFFGIPRGIKTGGLVLDIPFNFASAIKDGDVDKRIRFNLQVGIISSALEHFVPESMFKPSDQNAEQPDAISAVKALQKASVAGQKIYSINQENKNQVLPLINHGSDVMEDIENALLSGKVVITHTDAVSIPGGWSGAGYIIIDPDTGAGAYLISGGQNGGILLFIAVILLFAVIFFALTFISSFLLFSILSVIEFVSFMAWVDSIARANSYEDFRLSSVQTILNGLLNFINFPAAMGGNALRFFLDAITTMLSNPFQWFSN